MSIVGYFEMLTSWALQSLSQAAAFLPRYKRVEAAITKKRAYSFQRWHRRFVQPGALVTVILALAACSDSEGDRLIDEQKSLEDGVPLSKVICGEDVIDSSKPCDEDADYWTDERRRKAKPVNPTAPLPEHLSGDGETTGPTADSSAGADGQSPTVLVPTPKDKDD